MYRRWLTLLILLAALGGCSLGAPAPQTSRVARPGLYVDAGERLGPISPYVYGSNTGPWAYFAASERALFKAAGIRLLRWPGGNWGDENDPLDSHIDDFIDLCRELDAEPLVHVRLFNGTPAKAAALVRRFNLEQGFKVRYWAVGNEPNLYASSRRTPYTVADYVRDFKEFRAAMRAVDESIIVMGPEISQYTGTEQDPTDAMGVPWMDGFLQGVGDQIDMVSYHRYPFGRPGATPETLLADPPAWSHAIQHLAEQIRKITGRELPIGVTEVNSDWAGPVGRPAGPDSHLNALWWADVLGRLIRGRATIVAQFALGGVRGISMVGGHRRNPQPAPIYQVYLLYRHLGDELVFASSDDDRLPLFAALREDGALSLIVVNQGDQPRAEAITVDGFRSAGPAEVWSFAADHPLQQLGTTDLSRPVTFEPRAATVLIVPGRR